MGTYAKFYVEAKKDGEWEHFYVNDLDFVSALKTAESQDYFKYAFLSGVRNSQYLLKQVTKKSEIFKRDEETKEKIREEWGLNEPKFMPGYDDHIYAYYAENEISITCAKQLQNEYTHLSDVYLIDDLLEFDYSRKIEYNNINPDSVYLFRKVLPNDDTYLNHLDYFVDALKVLKSFGVERILITYD